MFPVPVYLTGAAHLRSPTGGFAYGMPTYLDTPFLTLAAFPVTVPLVVLTGCPGVHWLGRAELSRTSSEPVRTNLSEKRAILRDLERNWLTGPDE